MPRAVFRFYAELNDLLPPPRRQVAFDQRIDERQSVKDAIEALGVPHTEVDLVLVNGEAAELPRPLHDGDRVSVYPVFEAFDLAGLARVRPLPLREPRFELDVHLGRLARWLRLLGFDAQSGPDFDDAALVRTARAEHRIVLTRDRGLLKRGEVTHGYLVRSDAPGEQAVEVLRRFDLARLVAPFTRCLRCNGVLEAVEREAVADRLPPRVQAGQTQLTRCTGCARVYWPGSHHGRLARVVTEILARTQAG